MSGELTMPGLEIKAPISSLPSMDVVNPNLSGFANKATAALESSLSGRLGPDNSILVQMAAPLEAAVPQVVTAESPFAGMSTMIGPKGETAPIITEQPFTPLPTAEQKLSPTNPHAKPEAPSSPGQETTTPTTATEQNSPAPLPEAPQPPSVEMSTKHQGLTLNQEKELTDLQATMKTGASDEQLDRYKELTGQIENAKLDEQIQGKLDRGEALSPADENRLRQKEEQKQEGTKDKAEQNAERPSTEANIDGLNKDADATRQKLEAGTITPEEAKNQLAANEQARQGLVNELVGRHKKGEVLTEFEQKVAEKGAQMEALFSDINNSPEIIKEINRQMDAMEEKLKGLKATQTELSNFQITPANINSAEAKQNAKDRKLNSQQIAGISTNIALSEHSVGLQEENTLSKYYKFIEINNQLDVLVGSRHPLHALLVGIGSGLMRKATEKIEGEQIDRRAQEIAKAGSRQKGLTAVL